MDAIDEGLIIASALKGIGMLKIEMTGYGSAVFANLMAAGWLVEVERQYERCLAMTERSRQQP